MGNESESHRYQSKRVDWSSALEANRKWMGEYRREIPACVDVKAAATVAAPEVGNEEMSLLEVNYLIDITQIFSYKVC